VGREVYVGVVAYVPPPNKKRRTLPVSRARAMAAGRHLRCTLKYMWQLPGSHGEAIRNRGASIEMALKTV
jgi:hypothetical protein